MAASGVRKALSRSQTVDRMTPHFDRIRRIAARCLSWAGFFPCLAFLLVLVCQPADRAAADEADRIRELQQRVDAMERQNRALMRALRERQILSVDDNVDEGMIRQVDENEEDIPTELIDEDAHFRSLIREY